MFMYFVSYCDDYEYKSYRPPGTVAQWVRTLGQLK